MSIALIKLLNLANPKDLKETINNIIMLTNSSNELATTAVRTALEAESIAEESLNTSYEDKRISEEAINIAEQAEANTASANEFAEQAYQSAYDAVQIAENANRLAIETNSTVEQVVTTGVWGTFVYDVNRISLAKVYATDNPDQEDTEENTYLATPTAIRQAVFKTETALKQVVSKVESELSEQIENEIKTLEEQINNVENSFKTFTAATNERYNTLYQRVTIVDNKFANVVHIAQIPELFTAYALKDDVDNAIANAVTIALNTAV